MNPSDSLQLDEHLARLLAAYDQGLAGGDAKAPTLGMPSHPPPAVPPGERLVGRLEPGRVNEGSLGDVLPDSNPTAPHPDTPLLPPRPPGPANPGPPRIGRFELRKQLGKGGCGIVFLAYDPKLQREVALKIPRPEMLMSTDARRRLVREAQAAAEFDHPNLVPVYESGEIGPVCFVATAFCPGQTLAEWLDRQAFPVPVRQAARLIAVVAEAVQHAHDRGVLHRDIKPNNVILQEVKTDPADADPPPGSCPLRADHFIPRVVDFGLAKLAERGPSDTASRQILGTPKYMAPEQAQARHADVDTRADVYALGVILYELLAGRAPYEGTTDVEVLRQSIEGRLTHPRDLRKDIPRDLEAICLKAMERSPAKRYRTAIDLADDLRRYLDGKPTVARPLNRVDRAARWVRRNIELVALATVTLVAFFFLAVGLWTVYRSNQFRTDRDTALKDQADRLRADRQRDYARSVREAFLAWQAGNARPMSDALQAALAYAELYKDDTCFAWDYLNQRGRAERVSVACPGGTPVALAISPDGARWATGHADGMVTVYARPGTVVGSAKAHAGAVTFVAFQSDGSQLFTAGGKELTYWGFDPTGRPVRGNTITFSEPVAVAALVPGTRRVAYGGANGKAGIYDLTIGSNDKLPAVGEQPVIAIAAAPDGSAVALAGKAGPVRLCTPAGEPCGEIHPPGGVAALAFVPVAGGGWLVAVADQTEGTIRLFDRLGREVRSFAGPAEPMHRLAASPDGATLACAGMEDGVCVWDVVKGELKALLRGHTGAIHGLAFDPGGKALLTAGEDATLRVWEPAADWEAEAVRTRPAAVGAVAVHPKGEAFAVALADGSVELYPNRDAAPRQFPGGGRKALAALRLPETGPPVGVELTGREVVCWEFGETATVRFRAAAANGRGVTVVDLSPDATHLAFGDDGGRVAVWSVAERKPVTGFETGLPGPVHHLCYSDDGKALATPTARFEIGVWTVGESVPRLRVPGHGEGTWLVRFLPGGERLVTAGRGGSIKVWNLDPVREDLSLRGHGGRITMLATSADGRVLVSGSGTGEVKFWDLRTGQELIGLKRHLGPVTAAGFAGSGRWLLTAGAGPGGRGELAFWDASRD